MQAALGWPSTQFFKNIVSGNLVTNCPITTDDIARANHIYGTPIPHLQGKMTRHKPQPVKIQTMPIPAPILQHYPNIQLYTNFVYINNKPFLHTKSSKLQFTTIQPSSDRSTNSIIQGLKTVINLYQKRGFKVTDIHGDNEFNIESLHSELLPITVHIYAPDEHVHEIQRANRTFKEKCRII